MDAFKPKPEDIVHVSAEALRPALEGLFRSAGEPEEAAQRAADVLLQADLRAVESHGVSNMMKIYLDEYAEGTLVARAQWEVERERAATATINANLAHGLVIAPIAMQMAIEKARAGGLGAVTVHNAGHLGMAAYHAMLALPEDMVGVCMTAAGASVLPTFGREPRLGTNPIAIAAPAGSERPFVLDMATSVVPVNKVRNTRRAGHLLPAGIIAGADGTPILEPVAVPDPFLLLPLGSARASGSHKGYGLAAAVETLCSILSGAGYATVLPRTYYRHFLMAINIDAFTEISRFKELMDGYIRDLHATPPAAGHERVLVAGEPEWDSHAERSRDGIPLHKDVVAWLRAECATRAVPLSI
ncbi:MAG: Ldh family oxidoreductase [Chloroflexota bacterium]